MDGAWAGKSVFVRANIYVNDMFLYITTFDLNKTSGHIAICPRDPSVTHKSAHTQGCTNPGRQVAGPTRRLEFARRRPIFLNHPCGSQNSEVAPRLSVSM
jgi:hypothetical protein